MAAISNGTTCLYGVAGTVTNLFVQSYSLSSSFNAEATVVDEAGITKTHRLDDRKSEITIEGICKTNSVPVLGVALSFTLNAQTAYPSGAASVSFAGTVTKIDEKGSNKGFTAVKFAAAVADEGELADMRAIREAIGPDPKIQCDFHWRYTDHEAIKLITAMEPYDLYVAEAPVQSEDIEGQARVAAAVKTPVAIGEELRTVYEYRPRFTQRCMSIIQPEMAHTGITAFWEICRMAQAFHCRVMPHATIGVGIAQAASLQVSAALSNLVMHEYQHSIFDRNVRFVTGNMRCEAGYFYLPDGPGLGVEPRSELFQYVLT